VLLAGCSLGGNVFKYEITVDPPAAAEVDDPSGKAKVDDPVTITLTPKEGYEFVKWDGNVEPQKGDAEGKWIFVMPKKNVTLKAVFQEVKDPEEPVDEEALVQAVRDALDLEDEDEEKVLEAFMGALEALQDAGLLTDVVEEHGPAYLEQAKDVDAFVASSNPPYMRHAADIQEHIIDPVNEWVAEAIDAINGARTPVETGEAWGDFIERGYVLLDFEGFDLTNVDDNVVGELLAKYRPLSVADIRDIVYGAYVKGQVDDLFKSAAQEALGDGVDQTKIDEVAELVTEVAIDDLKAELEAAVVKAQGLWDEEIWKQITEGVEGLFKDFNWETFEPEDELTLNPDKDYDAIVEAIKGVEELLEDYRGTEDVELVAELLETAREMLIVRQINKLINESDNGKELASWIVNYMTITQFNELSAAQRDEVAGFLLMLQEEEEDEEEEDEEQYFKSSEEFIEAVVAEVGKYLELLGAVNAAATKFQMVVALEGLEYYKNYDYGVFANYVEIGIEDYDTQLRIAEDMFREVPFETISKIADKLQSLIGQYCTGH
jgi:hypothetical protein